MRMIDHVKGILAGATLLVLAGAAFAGSEVPAAGQSPVIDRIKAAGVLHAAAIGEFPWLPENTTGGGDAYSGPAWVLANEYANRLGVTLEIIPVSHETKVPILATVFDRIERFDHDLFLATVTDVAEGRLGEPPLLYSARHGWRVTGGAAREKGVSVRDELLARVAEASDDAPAG